MFASLISLGMTLPPEPIIIDTNSAWCYDTYVGIIELYLQPTSAESDDD